MPDDTNAYDLYGGKIDPERIQALAAEFRRRRAFGVLAALTGDPAASRAGGEAMQTAEQDNAQLAGAGKFSQELEQEKYRNLTQRLGLTRPETEVNPVTGGYYNRRAPPPQGGGAGQPGGGAYDKRMQPMLQALEKDLDPSQSRAGEVKANMQRFNAGQRLLALAQMPDGSVRDLNPQQMTELSTSLATLIGGGSSGAATREELTPYTKGRTLAQLEQWLTDSPHGADQRAFVMQMVDTAKREQGVAQDAIRKAQAQRLPAHAAAFQLFPEQAQNLLEAYGFPRGSVDMKTGRYTSQDSGG